MQITKSDKKNNILDAGMKLFSEKGFENTSMRDLASSADVNLAMINYYFQSKENLLMEVIKTYGEKEYQKIEQIVSDDSLTHMQRLEAVIDYQIAANIEENKDFNNMLCREMMLDIRPSVCRTIESSLIFGVGELIVKLISEGIEQGVFNNIDVTFANAMIFGSISHVCYIIKPHVSDGWRDHLPFENDSYLEKFAYFLKQSLSKLLLPS